MDSPLSSINPRLHVQPHLGGIAIRGEKYAPMQALESVLIGREFGLAGDSRGKPSPRQVTLLSAVSWRKAVAELGSAEHGQTRAGLDGRLLDWTTRRANLLVENLEFEAAHLGATLAIGDVLLELTKPCDPCYRMDMAMPGLQALLSPGLTAGVCAKVLRGGRIALGDPIVVCPAPQQHSLW